MDNQEDTLRVGFIHPDLGIGGAETLIIDLAKDLLNNGCEVTIYTPYFHNEDINKYNEEIKKNNNDNTKNKKQLLEVEQRGSLFPSSIFGRGKAFCALVRMYLATIYAIFFGGYFDVFIVDQVSAVVPLLRLCGRRCIFYCHYPDKLLCTERDSLLKKIYRIPLDYAEELSLLFSNLILVNSKFTQQIFANSFRILNLFKITPTLLYPSLNEQKYKDIKAAESNPMGKVPYFLSINRYERKKNIALAIKAFNQCIKQVSSNKTQDSNNNNNQVNLVIAGGFDEKVEENIQHFQELNKLANDLKIINRVQFLKNITDQQKVDYLSHAVAVLYTPENEHFGIVPLEGMYFKRPVIACNSGGPKESIDNENTGFLIDGEKCSNQDEIVNQWAIKMKLLLENPQQAKGMGEKGNHRVKDQFLLTQNSIFEKVKNVSGWNKNKKKVE